MEKLLDFIIKSIVQNPDKVKIEKEEKENFVDFQLEVDPEDIKIVIGKKGRTIRAIRNLLRLRARQDGTQVNLQLKEA